MIREMLRLFTDKDVCSGCMACMNICPKNAISEKIDECGFVYPDVDMQKCVHCGLCVNVCDFRREKLMDCNVLSAYGLQHNSLDVLRNSTSGGAFTAFSDWFLHRDGVVIGAVMDSQFDVFHVVGKSPAERDTMRGSKYVQSSMHFIYREMKELLESGKYVLFTGTPCQTAAVQSYFGTSYERLVVVDFLCHGTPSNQMLKDHIRGIEARSGKKATSYTFRTKRYTWNPSAIEGTKYDCNQRNTYRFFMQTYSQLFHSNASLRPSCLNCKYRSQHRYSDMTIADFWGVEYITQQKDLRGTSLVFINSERGKQYFSKMDNISTFFVPLEKILYRISLRPPNSKIDTEEFWELYQTQGYEAVVSKYCVSTLGKHARFILKKVVRRMMAVLDMKRS